MAPAGRVLQVNVSKGGVPKLPVQRAWVGRLGLEGDAHRERTVHGGPQRAVCLFGIEAIERLQNEGHPVEPGSVGENLTTTGIEWSLLPLGTRARIGSRLEIELASPTMPCSTQKPNFLGGRFSRIAIDLHPSDSRMYARVLREGEVRAGDSVWIMAPARDSQAAVHRLLDRIDPVAKESSIRLWAAAREAGFELRVLDDGDICAGASTMLRGPAFNHAHGLRAMPQLLPEVVDHFDAVGVAGLIPYERPSAGTEPDHLLAVHASSPADVRHAPAPAGVVVRRAEHDDHAAWIELFAGHAAPEEQPAWRALLTHVLKGRGFHPFVGELHGRPVATASLRVRHGTGLLRGGFVAAEARGRGIHRALIGARAALAVELGCELVAARSRPGSAAARNLERMGLPAVERHPIYRYVPRSTPA